MVVVYIAVLIVISNIALVSAIGIIDEDIGDYEYQEVALSSGVEKQDIIESEYQLKGTDKIFYARILPFDDNNDLSNYFNNRKSKINTKEYRQGTTYVEDNGHNLFWIYKNNIIFISSELSNPHDFPEEIIEKYLETYPNECNINWCMSDSGKLNEKDFIFKNVGDLESRIRDYTQRFIPCPSKNPIINDIKSKIQESLYDNNRFNDDEINQMITECKAGKEAFTVSLKEKTFIQECINKIKGKLSEDNVTKYKEFDIIAECVTQKEFKERYATEISANVKFFEDLFNKRILSASNEIKLKEATHERTEDNDEEEYLQILEQKRKHEDPSTFNPNANYTESTFPTYGGETTENFLQRFNSYFKRVFNLKEWFNRFF